MNEDMAKTKTGDIERGIRSEREAGKSLHEGETFKVHVQFVFHKLPLTEQEKNSEPC